LEKKLRIGWEWGYLLVITKYSVVDQKVIAAAAVIPAPIAYINVAAVKRLVVELMACDM